MSVGLRTTVPNQGVQHTGGIEGTSQPKGLETSGVKVGETSQPLATQTARKSPPDEFPLLKARLGNASTGTAFSEASLIQQGLASTNKAKVGFFAFLNKLLPNSLASKLTPTDVAVNLAARAYASDRAQGVNPRDLRTSLQSLRDQVSGGAHAETKQELLKLLDGELTRLDVAVDHSLGSTDPTQLGFNAVRDWKSYQECKAPYCGANNQRTDEAEKHTQSLVSTALKSDSSNSEFNAGSKKPLEEQRPEKAHKQILQCLKEQLDEYASTAKKSATDPTSTRPDVNGLGTLFRSNDDSAKFLRANTASTFPQVWSNAVAELVDSCQERVELDPQRLTEQVFPPTTDTNGKTLREVYELLKPEQKKEVDALIAQNQKLMAGIIENFCDKVGFTNDDTQRKAVVNKMPQQLCDQMRVLYEAISSQYGHDEGVKSVRANMILRNLAPSMISPHGGTVTAPVQVISEQITGDTQRTMVMMSKVVQNAANGVQFGGKELHMVPFNTIVNDRMDAMTSFAEEIIARGRTPDKVPG